MIQMKLKNQANQEHRKKGVGGAKSSGDVVDKIGKPESSKGHDQHQHIGIKGYRRKEPVKEVFG